MSLSSLVKKPILNLLRRWGVPVMDIDAPALRGQFKKFGKSWIQSPLGVFKNPQYISIGDNVCLEPHVTIEAADYYEVCDQRVTPSMEIGDGTHIRSHATFYCANSIKIGRNVLIGQYVMLSDLTHRYEDLDKPIKVQPITDNGWIVIEDDCFIGHGAMILPNVRIGKHSVVGAGAVVRTDVPAYSVVAGNPAKIVRRYDSVSLKWEKPVNHLPVPKT